MAALAAGLEAVRVAVQAAVEKKEGSWDPSDWSDVEDVVSFLLNEGEKRSKVVAAAVGLILYGATTQEKLQNVADNKEEFARRLTADKYGVPAAVFDMLLAQYVAGKSDRGRSRRAGRTAGQAAENSREAQPSGYRQAVERAAQDPGARR
jgi:hypothetical protein